MMTNKERKIWQKEREEVMKSYDVKRFKAFYNKYRARGVYNLDLPSDEIIEITMRKAVFHMVSATPGETFEAKRWLDERGFSTDL